MNGDQHAVDPSAGRTGLPVVVALAPPLFAAAGPGTRSRIEGEVEHLARGLGVPVSPAVAVVPASPAGRTSAMVALWVGGARCRFPAALLSEALAYLRETPLVDPVRDGERLLSLLSQRPDEDIPNGEPGALGAGPSAGLGPAGLSGAGEAAALGRDEMAERLGELLAVVVRTAISGQPGVLYPKSPARSALDLGVSLAGHTGVTTADGVEQLVCAAAADGIGVHIAPDYLPTIVIDERGAGAFPLAREGLITDLGLAVPSFRLVVDPSLRRSGFAFRFHSVRTLPRFGLAPETVFVRDSAERLRSMGVPARPTTDPVTSGPGAITRAEHRQLLNNAGMTVFDPFEYLVLAFSGELRRRGHALLTTRTVEAMLTGLSGTFPALVTAAQAHVPTPLLTAVLRALLRDQVSLRHLPLVLRLLLRHRTVPEEDDGQDPIDVVRHGLAERIVTGLAGVDQSIEAYVLGPELAALATEQPDAATTGATDATSDGAAQTSDGAAQTSEGAPATTFADALVDALVEALRRRPGYTLEQAQRPIIVTTDELAGQVRDAVRQQFPDALVLTFGDIPPRYRVETLAHLAVP